MAGWSSFAKIRPSTLIFRNFNKSLVQQVRHGGDHHKVMHITASRWQWHKFKDMFHFYVMLGAIPVTGIILYSNIFIGPAQLAAIPKDYEPKHWEYYRHPIQRFFARYIFPNPQQEYEKCLHEIYEESHKKKLRALVKQVHEKMSERQDYQAYYYNPAMGKYARLSEKAYEEHKARQ